MVPARGVGPGTRALLGLIRLDSSGPSRASRLDRSDLVSIVIRAGLRLFEYDSRTKIDINNIASHSKQQQAAESSSNRKSRRFQKKVDWPDGPFHVLALSNGRRLPSCSSFLSLSSLTPGRHFSPVTVCHLVVPSAAASVLQQPNCTETTSVLVQHRLRNHRCSSVLFIVSSSGSLLSSPLSSLSHTFCVCHLPPPLNHSPKRPSARSTSRTDNPALYCTSVSSAVAVLDCADINNNNNNNLLVANAHFIARPLPPPSSASANVFLLPTLSKSERSDSVYQLQHQSRPQRASADTASLSLL